MKLEHVDGGTVRRVDLSKFIAELNEKIDRDRERIRELDARPPEPVVRRAARNPLPALRYLEETREDFYTRAFARLDSIRRRR